MKTNKLRIVLDTNVLIVSLASHLKYHWVFERLVAGHYDLFVTNEMLAEYQEQVAKRYGLSYTEARLDFFTPFAQHVTNAVFPTVPSPKITILAFFIS